MIVIDVTKNDAVVTQSEKLTSGTVGLKCQFNFSEEWNELDKIAVCVCGSVVKDAIVDETNAIEIPWEVLAKHGKYLDIGVYGTDGNGKNVIPTVYATVGAVCKGADPSGDESIEPTPSLWEQVLSFIKNVPYTIDAMGKAIFHGHAESASTDEKGNLIHSHYASKEYAKDTFSNVLIETVSGVGAIRLGDVSPLAHGIDVTTDDPTTFKSYGKNLCDISKVTARNANESATQVDNTTFDWNGSYYFEVAISLPAGTTFTYSWGELVYDYTTTYPLRLNSVSMVYSDGTVSAVISNTYTLTPEKDVKAIRIYKSVSDSFKTTIKNLQIEIGNAQTVFEAFKPYVDGVVAILPTTTLISSTSGVQITAEYSKDINKVIQELKNAILNLGGTI